ncbi:MAG: hypothetical protein V4530_15525 [Pseudomonadota bacterium]
MRWGLAIVLAISTTGLPSSVLAQATTASSTAARDIDAIVKPILDALIRSDAKGVVDTFVAKSPLMAGKTMELTNLQAQIQNGLTLYGKISDFDLAQEQIYGTSAVRRYYVAAHANLNTRWEFIFSRTSKGWVVAYMGFEDQQRTWFK